MSFVRAFGRRCALSVVVFAFLAQSAFGQAGPIVGSAPVRTTSSAGTPLIGDSFSVDVEIDLTSASGETPVGTAPAAVTAFRVPLTFDRERLELKSIAPGRDGSFALAGLDATAIPDANASGQLIIAAAQTGTAPTGIVSIATLQFRAKAAGAATIAADTNAVSLASAIHTSAATLFGPALIPVHGTGGGVVVQTPPALKLTLEGGPSPATPDGQLVLVVRCESTGGAVARDTVVRVTLPAGASYSGASASGVHEAGVVTWTVGDLAPNAAFEATLALDVTASAGATITTPPATAQASNVAAVTSAPVSIRVAATAPVKPGMIVAASSYGYNVGAIFDVTSGKPVEFARVPSRGWVGGLLFTPTGRLIVATNYAGGSLFDASAGGDLTGATPFVRGLGSHITGLTRAANGDLYVSSLAPRAQVRKVSNDGAITLLPRAFDYPGDVFAVGNTLYVSEGATGTIWTVDLATNDVASFATGFTAASTHFSGQLTRNSLGKLFVFWKNANGVGLFDVTAGGNMAAAQPITAKNAFRVDVNDIAVDARDNIYFAGDGSGKVWRAPFASGAYGVTAAFADGVSDTEAVAVYPLPNVPLLDVTTTAAPDPAVSGRNLVYTITVTNAGGAAAQSSSLTAALPAGVTYKLSSDGGTVSGENVTWSLGTLASGASVTRTVTVTVAASPGATLEASPVTVTATGNSPVQAMLPALSVVSAPDLRLSVSAPASVPSGSHITYTIAYSNEGGSPSAATVIEQTIPTGTKFAVAESGTRASSTAPVVWTLGTVQPGQSGSVTIVVLADAAAGTTITNSGATIKAEELAPVAAAAVKTTLTAASSIDVTVVPAPNPVVPGTRINTRVTYRNTSATTAQSNVTVSVALPADAEFISATGGGVFDGTNVTWSVPTLAASASATVRVSFRTRAAANTAFTMSASSASMQFAPAMRSPVVVNVRPYPSAIQPGVVLSGISYEDGRTTNAGRVTALSAPTVRSVFCETNDGGWLGPLLIAPDGHVYAGTNAHNGSIFDITPGGDLRAATPIATGLGRLPATLVMDSAGNLYTTGLHLDARIRKISPDGEVSPFGPAIKYGGGIAIDEAANVLYLAEGTTGSVHRVDLTSGASTVFATGFTPHNDHFSGQIVRTRQGRMYMLWGYFSDNLGLFDITAGGNFAGATAVTGAKAFRLDVNQMTIGPNDDIYLAGNANNHIYRTVFVPATQTYEPMKTWALNLGDNESIAIFPAYRLTITGAASVSSLNRGESATFTFTYANATNVAVTNAAITIPLPPGFTLESASEGAVVETDTVQWNVGTLAPEASGTVSITGRIDAPEGSTFAISGYTATGDGRASATGPAVNVLVVYPLSIQVRATPEPVVAGQTLTYALRYENLNPAAATNVVIRSEIPVGTTFLTATGGATRAGRELTWTLASIAGGSTGEVTFTARADAPPAVTLASYSITSQQLGTRTGQPITTSVLPVPVQLSISAAASPDPVTAGATIRYSIHYANDGGSPASNAFVRAEVPPATRFAFSEAAGALDGNSVVWQLGTVAPLSGGVLSYTVVVDEEARGTVVNDAIAITTEQQSLSATAITTRIVAPPPPAPLSVSVVAEPSPVSTGALLSYRVEVTNPDTTAAKDVLVLIGVPDRTSLVSTTGPATQSGNDVQWTLGELQPGDSITLGMVVRAPAAAGVVVNDGATAAATGRETATSASVTTDVIAPAARLELKLDGPESVLEGATFAYRLSYRNEGSSAATSAAVAMPLPNGAALESTSPTATVADGVVTWSVGELDPNEDGTVEATVRAQLPVGSTIANSGSQMHASNAATADAETLLTVVVAPPPVFTGTLATNKSAYIAPEDVQQNAALTYASGGSGVAGALSALLETRNANGAVLASHSQSIEIIAVGDTVPVTFTWPTLDVPTGNYEVTFTVFDATGVEVVRLARTFAVSSPDGAKLSGTITPTNSPVPLGSALEVQLALKNESAFTYQPLPLEVAILDPGTLDVLVSSPVSNVDVPANGEASRRAMLSTAGLAVGTYPIWLTTSVGGGRLLDTDEATIVAPLLTIAPAAQSIVAGSTAVLTVALSAPAAHPIEIALNSSNSAIATAPATVTIPTGASSQSFAVQGSGAGGPVTITAALPASMGGGTAAATVTVLLSGQLTAKLEIYRGENLGFDVSIANGGSNALVDGSFAIEIVNGDSGAVVDTIAFTASIAAGSTFTRKLTYDSTSLAAQRYEARLIWLGLVPPQLLASALFNVSEPPPLRIEAAIGTKPRVVIWTNCSPGNSSRPCVAVKPPFLTATLDSARIPYVMVGEQNDFLAKLRTGAFSAAIIAQAGENEAKIAPELVASIHAGVGLFFIHSAPNAMPKLSPALGTTFTGKLLGPTTLHLRDTPFTAAASLTLNGDGVKLASSRASTVATIAATETAAIVHYAHGSGRSVTVPFDLELTPTPDVARFIVAVVRYVARTAAAPFTARDVVPLHVDVTTPPGGEVPVTVALTLPAGVSVVAADPALASDAPTRWSVSLPGATTTGFDVWLRLTDNATTSSVTVSAAITGGPPIDTATVEWIASRDAGSLRTQLQNDLAALQNAARTNQDVKALADAVTALNAIATSNDAVANVGRVLTIIEKLQGLSAALDASAARASADRLLLYWQSRVGA